MKYLGMSIIDNFILSSGLQSGCTIRGKSMGLCAWKHAISHRRCRAGVCALCQRTPSCSGRIAAPAYAKRCAFTASIIHHRQG
jgi:hypothetical protein